MFVQVPSTLDKVIHFQILSPLFEVLMVVLNGPVIIDAFLKNKAIEDFCEVLNGLDRQTELRVDFGNKLNQEVLEGLTSEYARLDTLLNSK